MKNGLIIDKYGHKRWFKDDFFHNENGPAVELTNGSKYWFINDKLHRLDGPAKERFDGVKIWYYQGEYIDCNSQEEFERYIKRLVLL